MTEILAAVGAMLAAFALGTAINVGAVMLPAARAGGGLAVRALALAMSVGVLVVPFHLDTPGFFKSVTAQALIIQTWRVFEILRTPERYGRRERALRVILLMWEFTFLERTPRRWPIREMVVSSALLAVGIAGLVLASRLGPAVAPYQSAGWPRWLGCMVAAYVLMEGMTLQWVGILPAFGWRHRPYQRHPILSRTIAEFWGVRWSSVVHRWLHSNMYEPLARRRAPRAGVIAAFGMSAVLHAYLVWPAAGLVPALWMLSFFVLHGLAMILEAKLRVRRWRPVLGRAFVVGVFVATVPLFLEPILRALGL